MQSCTERKAVSHPKLEKNDGITAETVRFKEQLFDVCQVDLEAVNVQLYWRDRRGNNLKSLQRLKEFVSQEKQQLLFATNGGMYRPNHTPQGLYVEQQKELNPIDLGIGKGNFYLKPNGVFLLTEHAVHVIKSEEYSTYQTKTHFATQSGPLLVYQDTIHHAFREGSTNLHIRSGVGVTKDGKVVFAISKKRVNFYDFATLFRDHYHCPNALYLDGFVSKMYLPALNRLDLTGDFGVMIGVTPKQKK